MPWKVTGKMKARTDFIHDVTVLQMKKAEACRRHGISRPTGDVWLKRYELQGIAGLEDLSHAPHEVPHRTAPAVEALALQLRERYPTFGPKKLHALLARQIADVPSASTIGGILSRHGLTAPPEKRRRTPPYTHPLRHAQTANQVWSIDFKGQFLLRCGKLCYPLTITDNATRMILAVEGLEATHTGPVRTVMERVFGERGLPNWIRSDNGAPFASGGVMGLSQLSVWWLSLGIGHERIEPGHPEQNGRHERMHLTLKRETTRPAAHDMAGQQQRFDAFCKTFNEIRPHEALGQTPPSAHWQPSTRTLQQVLPLDYSRCDLVKTIRPSGEMRLAKLPIFVGQALSGQQVGLTEIESDVWMVTFAGIDLGLFEPGDTKIAALETGRRSRLHAQNAEARSAA